MSSPTEWNGPFTFIQAADTQLGLIDILAEKENPKWEQEIELTRKAITFANQMNPKPKFFVVCGDLVHDFTDQDRRHAQIKDFKELFSQLHSDIPLVCVCGNHDVGDQPTHKSIDEYKTIYGDDHFTFVVSGVLMIVINSSLYPSRYSDPSLVTDLVEEQNKWIDSQLALCGRYKHAIVFQHIPWFIDHPDEENDFGVRKDIRLQMLQKFDKAGVKAIFCGHYHGNAGGKYGNVDQVVTSAVGAQLRNDKSGLRIVNVTEDSIQHVYHEI